MKPLAVYVHVPFCTVKCGYCDFNAYAGMDGLVPAYEAALLQELDAWQGTLDGRRVTSISFGGGTPGEFPGQALAAVVQRVRSLALVAREAELSIEANPGTTTLPYLQALRAAGINRISFGGQSFDPGELRFLDRIHSPEAIGASMALAREAGFENIGLDLIYGLPGQTPAAWAKSLERAMALRPDHLSCYALTVEEGTPLAHRVARGEVTPLDPDAAADLYEHACDALASAGYVHYEISNWARPGHESRHNLVYWTDGEYLGVGAGAHGYLGGERYENVAHPGLYNAAAARGSAVAHRYIPGRTSAMSDWLETATRLLDGFAPAAFEARFDVSFASAVPRTLAECAEAGILEVTEASVRLTPRGLLLQGEVCARFLAELQQHHESGTLIRNPKSKIQNGAPL